MLYLLQIVLHHIALLLLIFYQVSHFQHPSIVSLYIVDACVIILMIQLAYHLHDLSRFLIFTQSSRSSLIHTGYVDNGFLGCIKNLANMIQIRTMIEVITQYQILQILIAIQLLIIIIGNGEESGFILCPQHWNAITTEVTSSHGYNVSCRVVHHSAHHIAQIRIGICTGMVELIDGQQYIIESIVAQFLGSITQGGMGTNKYLSSVVLEELLETSLFILLVLYVCQIEIRWYFPIGKESSTYQIGVLE